MTCIVEEDCFSSFVKSIRKSCEPCWDIVLTNGCFDPLHYGHISMLREARSVGKMLIVALNTDISIMKAKRRHARIRYSDRALALGDIRTVDYVIPLSKITPLDVIDAIRPGFLVKGGDYSLDKIVGRDQVMAYGGQVLRTQFVPGISSSALTAGSC